MYLDTDVILAELKVDDWLASAVDIESIAEPKTSIATSIELQYVMEDTWERARLANVHQELGEREIQLVPLTVDAMDAATDFRTTYEAVNVFDAVHLGTARSLDEPIVSTDTLFPELADITHVDPRDLD